jgi:hypothetical protein
MIWSGWYQARKLSFSAKVATGRMMSAMAMVVGVWKESTTTLKSIIWRAL